MNLFILSQIIEEIVEAMMDKHVVKIILEAVQMLCVSKRILDPNDPINETLYKVSHANHPVTKWCRESRENFVWTLDFVDALHTEWKLRFKHKEDKMHLSYPLALLLRQHIPDASTFAKVGLTPFALAMPDEYKDPDGDAVKSYRAYYMSPQKQAIASWKEHRGVPSWYVVDKSIVPLEKTKVHTTAPKKKVLNVRDAIALKLKIRKNHY